MKRRWRWRWRPRRRRRQTCPECGERLYRVGAGMFCGSCPYPYYKGKVKL